MITTAMSSRSLRAAREPLGNFIRLGYNDHTVLAQALSERRGTGSGLILNPVHAARQLPLVSEANAIGVETILDSKSLELSTPGGYALSGVADLPWAADGVMHTPISLRGRAGAQSVRTLAEYVAEAQFTGVLAPTHFVQGLSSPWWSIDGAHTRLLRATLDELEMADTVIYYPIIAKAADLLDDAFMGRLVRHLEGLPVDSLWLRLHPFGTTNSGPLTLRRYLRICRRLHALGIPLVAEHSGSVGVALLAFGAVGGIESGVTFTDTVNLDGLLHEPRPGARGFLPQPRVYLHQIGAFIEPHAAQEFFAKRGTKTVHACQDASCCPRASVDMLADPRGHYLRQRAREITQLTAMPESLRPGHYMENFLRPASDRAVRAAELEPSLVPVRKRLDSWRRTLGADLEQHSSFTISPAAAGRRLRPSA